jgi:hypothetical protein
MGQKIKTNPAPSMPESPLLPLPTSPMMQSDYESYRNSYDQSKNREYPYDRRDDIVSREIDNEDE